MNERYEVSGTENEISVCVRRFGSWRIAVRRLALSPPELVRRYDRAAPRWGRAVDRLGYSNGYQALLRQAEREGALTLSGVPPRVLDCGVGTGTLSSALARVLPVRFRLDAIDLSPRMLERARVNLADAGIDARLRHADVRALPFCDDVFDLVMTAHVLEHLSDPRVGLGEMIRVLKPGGTLIVCLTRRSALGLIVQLAWRTHRVTAAQAGRWLRESGLERVMSLSMGNRGLCRRMSVACVGRKPGIPGAGGRLPALSRRDRDDPPAQRPNSWRVATAPVVG